MNKKIKISLLSVLLTSSLSGVATTIASCSASAIPELTIEKNPNLITELDKELTEYLANLPSDNDKSMEFDSWLKNGELPQNAKDVISQNIVFKNGSKVVPFNDVFEKFVVSNLSGFPQNPINPIPAINIEIKIKEDPFVIASSSTSLLKFKTGELGYLNPVPISGIVFEGDPVEIKKTITTELNRLMDAAITYQDKFTLYTQWTRGTNFPSTISNLFFDTVQFQTNNHGILTWNQVFDKFEITATSAYPVGPNAPLPNMTLTTKLLGNCTIDPTLLDKNLKFSNIGFTSNTGKIKLDVQFKDSIFVALQTQLSKDLSVATTFQERKKIFNNWNNSAGEMKPGSISLGTKETILSNLEINKFGYNNPLTIDDFFSRISIIPVNSVDLYPNDFITDLPLMKLVLVLDEHKFANPISGYTLSIDLPPLNVNSGVGEFDLTISNTLEKDMTNLFTNELNGNYASNKTKYESWNSYNTLPLPVKNALKSNIIFSSNIDIPDVNTLESMIDIEKTEIIKQPFPNYQSEEIKTIQIKFVLKPGRFVKIDGSLTSKLPLINISNLPLAEARVYTFVASEFPKIDDFVRIIRERISYEPTFQDKKSLYDGYNKFENLPFDAISKIDSFQVYDKGFNYLYDLSKLLESKIIYKEPFPSIAGQPIPPITLELKLNKASKMLQDGKYYKILPIVINFDGITS